MTNPVRLFNERSNVSRQASLVAIGVVVSALSAVILSPGFSKQQTPELKASDIGKPFRASSLSGYKSPRDLEVLDAPKTQSARDDARSRVKMVFDLDASVKKDIVTNVHEAFGSMQQLVDESVAAAAAPKAKPADAKAGLDAELVERLRLGLAEFWKVIEAPEAEDIDVLLSARFSPELEQATVDLIERAYRSSLVQSREELNRLGASTITVRTVGSSTERDSAVVAPTIVDLREVGDELERWVGSGNSILPDAPQTVRRAVLRLSKKQLRPNLTVNIAETEARRRAASDAVKPVVFSIKKGQRLIGDGELIADSHLLLLNALRAQAGEYGAIESEIGSGATVFLLLLTSLLFFRRALPRFQLLEKDALFLGALLLAGLGMARLFVGVGDALQDRAPSIPVEAIRYLFPIAALVALVRFLVSRAAALFLALVASMLTGMLHGNSLTMAFIALVSSFWVCTQLDGVKEKSDIVKCALLTAVGVAVAIFCAALGAGKGLTAETAFSMALAFTSHAVGISVVLLLATPAADWVLGYASDFRLLSLSSLNHPALKELVLQAPGTYHHSIILGSLVEPAAKAIGANPLLARACAYYHDIGKGKNPAYFGENQKVENPHEGMTPVSSAVVIRRHVADGIELARQYRLPQRVTDVITQHHGTRLVGNFYQKALAQSGGAQVDESVFRYTGPKPQSVEVALVMLADTVEAATRNMGSLEPKAVVALVSKLFNELTAEGQLDECDLSLRELALVAESFASTLDGLARGRRALGGTPAVGIPALTVISGGQTESGNGKETSA